MIENRLAILMKEKDFNIEKIIKLTGLNSKTITNLYYKKTKSITVKTLDKLCRTLNCEPDEIIRYIPDEKSVI